MSVKQAADNLQNIFLDLIDKFIPTRVFYKANFPQWVAGELKALILKKKWFTKRIKLPNYINQGIQLILLIIVLFQDYLILVRSLNFWFLRKLKSIYINSIH